MDQGADPSDVRAVRTECASTAAVQRQRLYPVTLRSLLQAVDRPK